MDYFHVFSLSLVRKATKTNMAGQSGNPCGTDIILTLLKSIDDMAKNCQLTEFTDHGISHISNLMKRVEKWTNNSGARVIDVLSVDECFILVMGILLHDIGMLSQNESDLPTSIRLKYKKQFTHIPTWVRVTHVERIRTITRRILEDNYTSFTDSDEFNLICFVAESHHHWPDYPSDKSKVFYQKFRQCGEKFDSVREYLVAAILAVVDLLDEDSTRCDSMTLLVNKAGDLLNKAHWLRHMLTCGELCVQGGLVEVTLCVPTNIYEKIPSTILALHNHLKMAERYNSRLKEANLEIKINFDIDNIRKAEDLRPGSSKDLQSNKDLQLILLQPDIHLLRTFPQDAMITSTKNRPEGSLASKFGLMLQTINLERFDDATKGTKCDFEISLRACKSEEDPEKLKALWKIIAEDALNKHHSGEIITLHKRIDLFKRYVRKAEDIDTYFPILALSFFWSLGSTQTKHHLRKMGWGKGLNEDSDVENFYFLYKLLILAEVVLEDKHLIYEENVYDFVDDPSSFYEDEEAIFSEYHSLAWYCFFESLWIKSYFEKDTLGSITKLLDALIAVESKRLGIESQNLRELKWRMYHQSQFLKGLHYWQGFESNSTEYFPSGDLIKLRCLWKQCIFRDNLTDSDTIEAGISQGSTLYVPYENTKLLFNSMACKIILPLMGEVSSSVNKLTDEADSIIMYSAARIGNSYFELKKDGTKYAYLRSLPDSEYVYATRIAMRRWDLYQFKRLTGLFAIATMKNIHMLIIEGELEKHSKDMVENFLETLKLQWWISPFSQKELLKYSTKLMPQIETYMTIDTVKDFFDGISQSPPSVWNIPCDLINFWGDALPEKYVQEIAKESQSVFGRGTRDLSMENILLKFWIDLIEKDALRGDIWEILRLIAETTLKRGNLDQTASKYVKRFLQFAPIEMANHIIGQIIEVQSENIFQFATCLVGRELDSYEDSRNNFVAFISELKKYVSDRSKGVLHKHVLYLLTKDKSYEVPDFEFASDLIAKLKEIAETVEKREGKTYRYAPLNYVWGLKLPVSEEEAQEILDCWETISRGKATYHEFDDSVKIISCFLMSEEDEVNDEVFRALTSQLVEPKAYPGMFYVQYDESPNAIWPSLANYANSLPEFYLQELFATVNVPNSITQWSVSCLPSIAFILGVYIRRFLLTTQTHIAANLIGLVRARVHGDTRNSARTFVSFLDGIDLKNVTKIEADLLLQLIDWGVSLLNVTSPELRRKLLLSFRKIQCVASDSFTEKLNIAIQHLENDIRAGVRASR